jgi:hypothetical protein
VAKIIRPLKFDTPPRKAARLRKRRVTDAKRRERLRDTVQRRLYRMVEPSWDILWEESDNDNFPAPPKQR